MKQKIQRFVHRLCIHFPIALGWDGEGRLRLDLSIETSIFYGFFFLLFPQFPVLCGLPFLERRASQTAHLVAGRSGKHLFLTDDENDGKPPLLLRMVTDSEDIKFMSVLTFT